MMSSSVSIYAGRRGRTLFGFIALFLSVAWSANLSAQVFPLSENSWSNPEFVKRFLGSYGAMTDREPKVTTEEAAILQQVAPLMQNNDYQGAIAVVQAGITPESSAALEYTIGNLALQSGNYALAEQNYRAAIRKFPNFLRSYKNLGLTYVQQGKFMEARDMFVKALELGDSNGDTYGLVAYCYLNAGDMAKARDAYGVARVLNPGNKDWVVGYAQALIATAEYAKAISVFEELIAKEPSRADYYKQIANAYISLKDFESATRFLEIIRRMGKGDAPSLVLLGDLYINAGLLDLALNTYLEASDASGTITESRRLGIVRAFLRRQAYDQADKFLNHLESSGADALSENTEAEILNLRAELAIAQGQKEDAIATLEKVTEIDPFNGRALLLLGGFYVDSDPAKAIYYYELAQNIDSVAAEAYIEHGRLRVGMREYTKAIDLLEQAQSIEYKATVARYLDAVRRVMDAAR